MKEADFFVRNSLLQEVGDSFRLHDLLLDFIMAKCHGEDVLVSLIWLWQKLVDLSGNEQLEVDVYSTSLGELGDVESTDTAVMYQLVARLLDLQVGSLLEIAPSLEVY